MFEPFRHLFRALRYATSPAERYRHARVLHGVRVALAMLASILVTSGIDIPHGIWASVSLLVVIGGLQHQGNIRQKAFERALGTAFGAVIGLLWVAQYAVIGSTALTYALLSITAGICGYHAIGKGGYIALLTAITMCIVAGHGDDSIEIGLWRTANVLIGIGIALAFSFALPLLASYSWRYGLAANLRGCAGACKRLSRGTGLPAEQQLATFAELSRRLIALRGMMPSVSKESGMTVAQLEAIQLAHRSLLGALEMMGAAQPADDAPAARDAAFEARFRDEADRVRRRLLRTARALRTGRATAMAGMADEADAEAALDLDLAASSVPRALQGSAWALAQVALQTAKLQRLLVDAARAGRLPHA